ncbi:palmitoyltransferase-like protein [Thermochaetoides thermophila DSM 1495]|uniref:Palmitoyltransferase n=1 Tax=Chaetomium thermophilum (strain DSM 1495 / CBS 144.50 / IMI 039719) TaxID=759272 RepID=G0S146_CHATD|nr:palmitoyltransferase-like protein [Thermochaetoides thermophila DSM 1495]EGS22756.1 palmitoyltransferase-like protein [Thermochaetoides thermophila DSM 1495]
MTGDDGFPQFPRSAFPGPPSIISSRMTDIMTEDGGEAAEAPSVAANRRSALYSDGTSRPGTARTGMTGISQRAPWGQAPSLRQGLAGKRASIAGSVGGSSVGARPGSAMSRSHVPTLTSHAFFRPMSSQKLQAQRGLGRPGTMEQRRFSQYSNGGENRNSMISGPDTQAGAQLDGQAGDGDLRPPPSRGTEFTEQEGFSHITATTSPTHGHYPASSLADSVKPLQGRRDAGKNLVLDLDGSNSKTHKTPVNIPTPIRTPRSLRSSFILPRGDAGGGNREMEGGEKLESVASTPMPPGTPKERPESKKKPNLGRNYEYFEGSTILPRNLHKFPPEEEDPDPYRLGPPTTEWVLVKSYEKNTAAMEVPTKFCKTCNIWRPPRAHHCRLCDNCVETQDHHCVWLNNCVGRRNYRYFFTFVASAAVLGLYLSGASLAQILVYQRREDISFGSSINHFRVPFAMVIYGILAAAYPAALTGYHVFLMARGETTREYLNSQKFLKKDRYRAFTQANWCKNWIVVLCRPRPPSYYQFKRRYEEGDQRLSAQKRTQGIVFGRRKRERDEGMEMQDVRGGPMEFMGPVALRDAARPVTMPKV